MSRVTALDRLVGWFSPAAGLRRYFDRMRLQRAYEAASPRDPWKPRRAGASANADHAADAKSVRDKARALRQNVPYIRAGLDWRVAAIVGSGIVPTFRGRDGERLQSLWREWARVADADGRRDVYGLQASAALAMDVDGEVLIRIRARRDSDRLPVPIQLQLLEVDWLDASRTRGDGSNDVVNGVEYDALGRVVAYWLWDQHPGDSTLRRGTRTQSRRVQADDIIHLFAPERPGQGRGFSRLAPVISRVRDLQLYEDAELARKNNEARLGILVSGDASGLANPMSGRDDVSQSEARQQRSLGELSSGAITELPPGLNVTVVQPTVAQGYTEYVKHQLHLICAGAGFTYEAATGDMRETNFSSARVRQIDARREIEQLQWLVLVPGLCDRIVERFVAAAVLAGRVRDPEYYVEHSTPKWDYVNPRDEIDADLREISGGLSSISEKLRRRGYDPEAVFDELQRDVDGLRSRGLLDVLLAMQKARTPTGESDGGGSQSPK